MVICFVPVKAPVTYDSISSIAATLNDTEAISSVLQPPKNTTIMIINGRYRPPIIIASVPVTYSSPNEWFSLPHYQFLWSKTFYLHMVKWTLSMNHYHSEGQNKT